MRQGIISQGGHTYHAAQYYRDSRRVVCTAEDGLEEGPVHEHRGEIKSFDEFRDVVRPYRRGQCERAYRGEDIEYIYSLSLPPALALGFRGVV